MVFEDDLWIARHSLETNILGYLILESKRHFLDLSHATRAERETFGLVLGELERECGAVARNRLRRIIRESFRLHQHELPAADLVVSARPSARSAAAGALRDSLAALWKKVGEQCATSPPR